MAVLAADILISRPQGQLIAAVEVKNREDLSPRVANELRRNLIARGTIPDTPYFLLVSQDKGYLWHEGPSGSPAGSPIEFPMDQVVDRYLGQQHFQGRLRHSELEFLVQSWLWDIREGQYSTTQEPETLLAESGFLDALRGAVLTWEER
jgi:hypothetical protein